MAASAPGIAAAPAPSPEQIARELARCGADPVYFINHFATILVQQPNGSRAVQPFVLWDYQSKLVTALAQGGHFMILKARQLGCTTVMCAYALWVALFKPHSYILLLSKAKNEAVKLLRRVKETYRKLPAWLRAACPIGEIDNTLAMSFGNGTLIEAMASTEGAGRSDTATLVLLDEADYMEDLEATYSAVRPTVDGGGQLVLMSTSQGPMTFFAKLWEDAVAHVSDLRAVFFPWYVRPDRTEDWYAKKKGSYAEHRLKREYPTIWQDAFQSNALLVYPDFSAGIHMDEIHYDPETRTITTRKYGSFKVTLIHAGQDFNNAVEGCAVVTALATDGTLITLDGWYEAGVPVVSEDPDAHTWANIHRKLFKIYRYTKLWCDHDPESIRHLQQAGLPAVKAIKDVDSGISLVTAALRFRGEDGHPGFILSNKMEYAKVEFYSYCYRTVNGQVVDRPVKDHDHYQDAQRYSIAGLKIGLPKISVF